MKIRWAVCVAWCLMVPITTAAQVVYNTEALQFEHTDYANTSAYILNVFLDPDVTTPIYTFTIPKENVTPVSGTTETYRIDSTKMPVLPVGMSYRASLVAANDTGQSPPSNITPSTFRLSPCATMNAVGVLQPSVLVGTIPPLTRGRMVGLPITVNSANPVAYIQVDLLGDGQPAWYYVLTDARPATTLAWGPLKTAGRFEMVVTTADTRGCQAQLNVRTWVTVAAQ